MIVDNQNVFLLVDSCLIWTCISLCHYVYWQLKDLMLQYCFGGPWLQTQHLLFNKFSYQINSWLTKQWSCWHNIKNRRLKSIVIDSRYLLKKWTQTRNTIDSMDTKLTPKVFLLFSFRLNQQVVWIHFIGIYYVCKWFR